MVIAQEDHTATGTRPESERESPVALDPSAGDEIGLIYQAFLSPQQEGGEEEDTPRFVPDVFRSTAPSVTREERPGRGHGVIEFTSDFSRAYVYLAIENVDVESIAMLHIHCGRPGQLGPILIDFAQIGDIQAFLADGVMNVEVTNADIEAVVNDGDGLIGAFTAGCPIVSDNPTDKVKTIAGMAYIAREGDLYFNLHTDGQMYFGDIRGQVVPLDDDEVG